MAALESQLQNLHSGETQRKEKKLSKEDGKKESGGYNTYTRGTHGDTPCPGLERKYFICKEKGTLSKHEDLSKEEEVGCHWKSRG